MKNKQKAALRLLAALLALTLLAPLGLTASAADGPIPSTSIPPAIL